MDTHSTDIISNFAEPTDNVTVAAINDSLFGTETYLALIDQNQMGLIAGMVLMSYMTARMEIGRHKKSFAAALYNIAARNFRLRRTCA